ncbi:MAG TPA: exopolyphosphatase, partial [Alcanivorax sp.]|nr:exopolyphosphatase [Alcanivorax sp.]
NGWSTEGISLEGLDKARRKAIKAGSADALSLKGLRDDRKAIFASGLAILLGIFEQMGLAHM